MWRGPASAWSCLLVTPPLASSPVLTLPACLPPQVALLLGGAVGVTAVLLQRSWAEQARLTALLSKRETDLARLVSLD